jgi:hypothetical protein
MVRHRTRGVGLEVDMQAFYRKEREARTDQRKCLMRLAEKASLTLSPRTPGTS